MIIAIDGPAGTGKSTIASIIAKKLGITYLNSGSFYRALTLALNESSIDISDSDSVVEFCKKQKLDYANSRLVLNGVDVEDRLHDDSVSSRVAQVSSIIPIRHLVNDIMQEITKSLDIICEGRDMTTVVFPNAEYKFYLDASIDVQAQRRFDQGVSNMTLEEVKESIKKRDKIDKNKAEGALKISPDAFYIDTSSLTIENVCEIILAKIHSKGFNMEMQEVENSGAQSKNVIQTQLERSLENMGSVEDGQVVVGVVVQVTEDFVFVDIGYKSEGRIPVREFVGDLPAVGDSVSVVVLKKDGRNGPEISKSKADSKQLWKKLRSAFESKTPIDGIIEKEVKGGFEVSLGGEITAFLPISQSDVHKVEDASKLIGLTAKFYLERLYSDSKVNVVVNRRKYLEEIVNKGRDDFFNNTQIGDTVEGVVKSFTSFGAFVDLGGFDGLLHINDMSWGHVTRPKDFVKKGQKISLKVIRLVPEEQRINLSLKHFTEDPWVHFDEKYHMNDIVDGTVTKITDFGAFIELEEGIEGLAHISEFSWTGRVEKPSDVVKIGEKLKCMVLGYDVQAGRVSLGLKQVNGNPWDTVAEKFPVGTQVHGKVVKLISNGAFIQLSDGIDGLLHAGDISWSKKIKHAGSVLKVNDEVDVVVLEVDVENKHITVGMKQLTDNPWKKFAETYKVGSSFEGEVTKITDFGVFVKAPDGIEGLVGKSNLTDDRELSFEEALAKFKVGDKVFVSVVDIDVERERVAFSVRDYKKAQAMKEISQYMASVSDNDSYNPFGDLLNSQKDN